MSITRKMKAKQPRTIDEKLILEINKALAKVDGYGSVELYIQENKVTQITSRNIYKTNNPISAIAE